MIRLKAVVKVKTIKPRRVYEAVKDELVDYMTVVKKDFDKTVATWAEKPEFVVQVSSTSISALIVRVSAHSPGAEEGRPTATDIYKFITRGTSVRYATMTPGFRPKSKVRVIGSGRGRGGLWFVSKAHPHEDGITAREWEEAIRERHVRLLRDRMQRAIELGARFD